MKKGLQILGVMSLMIMISAYSSYEPKGKFEIHMSQNGSQSHSIRAFLMNSETGEVWYLRDEKESVKVN